MGIGGTVVEPDQVPGGGRHRFAQQSSVRASHQVCPMARGCC